MNFHWLSLEINLSQVIEGVSRSSTISSPQSTVSRPPLQWAWLKTLVDMLMYISLEPPQGLLYYTCPLQSLQPLQRIIRTYNTRLSQFGMSAFCWPYIMLAAIPHKSSWYSVNPVSAIFTYKVCDWFFFSDIHDTYIIYDCFLLSDIKELPISTIHHGDAAHHRDPVQPPRVW